MNAIARRLLIASALTALATHAASATAAKLTLKDGRTIEGRIARISSMTENPDAAKASEGVQAQMIVLVDDDLRRTFVPKVQITAVDDKNSNEPEEKIPLKQPVCHTGPRVAALGPIVEISPFDEYGRRTLKMIGPHGVESVIQGITMLTPHWVKVEALQQEGRPLQWEQRIATSSIPPATLDAILGKRLDQTKLDQRLQVVRLYLQSERYKDAEERLKGIIADFPEGKQQYQPTVVRLRQAYARRILAEVRNRRDAGQHLLAYKMLEHFPTEDVAGETLVAVRGMIDLYNAEVGQVKETLEHFDADLAKIAEPAFKQKLIEIRDELQADLNINTLPRMAAYRQLWDDPQLKAEDLLSLAISGWLSGSNEAMRKLPVSVSLFETRNLVRRYLNEPMRHHRDEILAEAARQEGATPTYVAAILAHMKPSLDTGAPIAEQPGMYRNSVDALLGEPQISYNVQLPPEYDPHRKYPTIVTLHSAVTTPEHQIDWWAGARAPDGSRLGQATRHGYIVIAPNWAKTEQREYRYSAHEHAAVLNTLRDACRRFAIDTDRVFLSGHSMGGDAAWDLAVSHPDLWAGVIPITATSDRYISMYWENAKYVPFYLVCGELDGEKGLKNSRDLDRYMKNYYNATVVEFQGRGHEDFSDEILRLFDWMGRFQRNFFPRDFNCRSMRAWDNYFWWVEMRDLPPKTLVDPERWPPPRNTIPSMTKATITATNGVNVTTSAAGVTVWLAPEMVNFGQPCRVTVNGARLKSTDPFIEPSLAVMLEDVRTRGDRRHPFWAKVEMPGNRVNVAAN